MNEMNNLPEDILRIIYSKYFSNSVLHEIIVVSNLKNKKRTDKRNFLEEIKNYAIYEKAGNIVNSIINDSRNELVIDEYNQSKLDEIFYTLVDLHKNGLFDIFQI